MLRVVWWWLCCHLCSFLVGQAEAQSPVGSSERSRPYAVLRGQNLGERPRADGRSGRACASASWGTRSLTRGVDCGGAGEGVSAAVPLPPPFRRPGEEGLSLTAQRNAWYTVAGSRCVLGA